MGFLDPDTPFGQPAFGLSEDQIATVVHLTCCGADAVRKEVKPGMLEVPITRIVRKEMRRIKSTLPLTNLELRGEHELEDMATNDQTILGRIDITLKFRHQFGNEDAYVAIECKRVSAGNSGLNTRYVTQGVSRFATGQYATGHEWGFMLGYVLKMPVNQIVDSIDRRIQRDYGQAAKLFQVFRHPLSLDVLESTLIQQNKHAIRLKHIFVDMT